MKSRNYAKECLSCDGFAYQCSGYTPINRDEGELCVWYKVVDRDLHKIETGRGAVTFGELERIVKRQKIRTVKPCQE